MRCAAWIVTRAARPGGVLAETLRTPYSYERFAAGLTDEERTAPGHAGHGAIHTTILHLLSAHRNWLGLCDGSLTAEAAFASQLNPADYPDVAAVRALWRAIDARTAAYLARLDDAELATARRDLPLERRGVQPAGLGDPAARRQPQHPAPQRGGGDDDGVRPLAGLPRPDGVHARLAGG